MKISNHPCVKKMNNNLARSNTELELIHGFSGNSFITHLVVGTVKIDTKKRGAKMHAVASFCPFCGESLRLPSEGEAEQS